MKRQGCLVLSDGTFVEGQAFGCADVCSQGEVVFATSTTGYVELLTDPSYHGQILVLSHPEIGNYGVNTDDFQSNRIQVKGLVVRHLSERASNFRSQISFLDWIAREEVPVISGVDTRALILRLRDRGTMMGCLQIGTRETVSALWHKAKNAPIMTGCQLSQKVSVQKPKHWEETNAKVVQGTSEEKLKVAVLDFGVKAAILRHLTNRDCTVCLLPKDSPLEQIWALKPDGIFLSNGPGDPATEDVAVDTIKQLLGKIPIFGVCLGHQLLCRALGYETFKLKFGHRGSNHGVRDSAGRVMITSQNHGFAAELPETLESSWKAIGNLADETNEGLEIPGLYAFSVQFHPEGAPGPNDAQGYFDQFIKSMVTWKKNLNQGRYLEAESLNR